MSAKICLFVYAVLYINTLSLFCSASGPSPVAHPVTRSSPLPRRVTQIASHLGAHANTLDLSLSPVPASQTPRSSTRDLVAQTRSQVRLPSVVIPRPAPIRQADLPAGPLLRVPPLRKSLKLPSFMGNGNSDSSSEEDRTRPSTPVALDETDIGHMDSTPRPITQAKSRAACYSNVRVLSRRASKRTPHIPTYEELQLNALTVYKSNYRRKRARTATATQSARSRNILSSGELTSDQRAVVSQMEYHVLKDIIFVHPWPGQEERERYLWEAQRYASALTGVTGDEVFSPKFSDTVSSSVHLCLVCILTIFLLRYITGCRLVAAIRSGRSNV